MNKNYCKGRRFEYEIMRTCEKEGYKTYRMAGSHSQFDVFALLIDDDNNPNKPTVRAIQAKAGKSPYKQALKELRLLKVPSVVQKEIWIKKNRQTPEIIIA